MTFPIGAPPADDLDACLPARGLGKWSKPGVPHKGWTCEYVDDLGDLGATCEMCETQEIRYVHHMCHPEYPEELACGCICAGNMEGDPEATAAKAREKVLKNRTRRQKAAAKRAADRRQRFLGPWKISRQGNAYRKAGRWVFVVTEKDDGYALWIKNTETERQRTYDDGLRTVADAKARAFGVLERLLEAAA